MEILFILVLAIKYGETHTIAMCMNHLLGEFFEGCIESNIETARLRFNYVWEMLTDEQRQAVLDACPFQKWANKFADSNGLEQPYVDVGTNKYGITTWERVRPDPTALESFEDLPNAIYMLWKQARNSK